MEKYAVDITDEALADMEALYQHIAVKLQAPGNAGITDAKIELE